MLRQMPQSKPFVYVIGTAQPLLGRFANLTFGGAARPGAGGLGGRGIRGGNGGLQNIYSIEQQASCVWRLLHGPRASSEMVAHWVFRDTPNRSLLLLCPH